MYTIFFFCERMNQAFGSSRYDDVEKTLATLLILLKTKKYTKAFFFFFSYFFWNKWSNCDLYYQWQFKLIFIFLLIIDFFHKAIRWFFKIDSLFKFIKLFSIKNVLYFYTKFFKLSVYFLNWDILSHHVL